MVIFVTSNLRPNLSPSTNKSRTLAAGGGDGGKLFSSAESIRLLPSLLRGQGSARAGSRRGPQEAALPSRGKGPPRKFSRSLRLAMRSEPGGAGAREAFLQHSAAGGSQPGSAADNGSFSAHSPNTPTRLAVVHTPGGALEGQGKARLRRPCPRQPERPPNLAAPPGCSAWGGKLRGSRGSAARPGPGGSSKPQPCGVQRPAPGADPLLPPRCPGLERGAAGSGPAARDRARGSRRGREGWRAMPGGPAAGAGLARGGSNLTEEGLGRPRC